MHYSYSTNFHVAYDQRFGASGVIIKLGLDVLRCELELGEDVKLE